MALTWDFHNIKDHKTLCWLEPEDPQSRMNPITEALVWMTLIVGIYEITEKNYMEFYFRVSFEEKLNGSFLTNSKDPKQKVPPLTLEQVKSHIGLRTNAGSYTKSQFALKLFKRHAEDCERRLKAVA